MRIGDKQTNRLADGRFFFSNLVESCGHEYVGCVPRSWDRRFAVYGAVPLAELHRLRHQLDEDTVLVGMRTDDVGGPLGDYDPVRWKRHLEYANPGIMPYLDEVETLVGRSVCPSFFGNAFVCHRLVYREFVAAWRAAYSALYDRHKDRYSFHSFDPARTPSVVAEAITTAYFATRPDLRIVGAKEEIALRD